MVGGAATRGIRVSAGNDRDACVPAPARDLLVTVVCIVTNKTVIRLARCM